MMRLIARVLSHSREDVSANHNWVFASRDQTGFPRRSYKVL